MHHISFSSTQVTSHEVLPDVVNDVPTYSSEMNATEHGSKTTEFRVYDTLQLFANRETVS
jgi:hypothetical protein